MRGRAFGGSLLTTLLLVLLATTTAEPLPASPSRVLAFATPTAIGLSRGLHGKVRLVGRPPSAPPFNKFFDQKCPVSAQQNTAVLVDTEGMLKDVVVRIAPGQLHGEPSSKVVTVRHVGCQLSPRTFAVLVDQEVEFVNDESSNHNVRAWDSSGVSFAVTLLSGGPPQRKVIASKPVAMRINCDFHSPQGGYVVVTDHPYFAVTAADGSYHISGIPAGYYKVEALHGWYGAKSEWVGLDGVNGTQLDFTYEAPAAP
jgi:plastocyanin